MINSNFIKVGIHPIFVLCYLDVSVPIVLHSIQIR